MLVRAVSFASLFLCFCALTHAKLAIKKVELPEIKIGSLASNELFPSNLLLMDSSFFRHAIIVEKSTHLLHIYRNDNGTPSYITSFPIATGKTNGNKKFQGDLKTPEGIYWFTDFMGHQQLFTKYKKDAYQYGSGAFVTNYPNIYDKIKSKSGGGIWLHSTDDESRIKKGLDSRGCVVVTNEHLKKISQYIGLEKTPVIIVQDLKFIPKRTWETNVAQLKDTLNKWLDSWKNENIKSYLNHYSKRYYRDYYRSNYAAFSKYKKAVFNNPGRPEVNIKNISLLQFGDYAVAVFMQDYKSKTIDDTGKKVLHLIKDENYSWKILNESWSKIAESQKMPTTYF